MSNFPCLAIARFANCSRGLKNVCVPLTAHCVLRKFVSSSPRIQKLLSDRCQSKDGYDLAYTFPYVRVAAAINKLKLYQTFVSGLAIPMSIVLQTTGVISLEAALPIAAVSLTSVAALYSAGFVSTDLIGRMWVSRDADKSQVRLSTVNFWGKRSEVFLPANDLLPLTELPDSPSSFYVTLRRYSEPTSRLKLSLRFGQVENGAAFRRALGHAPL